MDIDPILEARGLKKAYWDDRTPVDPIHIGRILGLQISTAKLAHSALLLTTYRPTGQSEIVISKIARGGEVVQRQLMRVLAAYGLAYYSLYSTGSKGDPQEHVDSWSNLWLLSPAHSSSNSVEWIDQFVSELIMARELVEDGIANLGTMALSVQLGVPPGVLSKRITLIDSKSING